MRFLPERCGRSFTAQCEPTLLPKPQACCVDFQDGKFDLGATVHGQNVSLEFIQRQRSQAAPSILWNDQHQADEPGVRLRVTAETFDDADG